MYNKDYEYVITSSKEIILSCCFRGYHYDPSYATGGGYVCPSDVFYGRPLRAVNTYGEWKVIVNLPGEKYTQTARLEQCVYPGAPCSYISQGFSSSCLQKYSFVRLLAYTHTQGLHIDTFKLPVACSCHVTLQFTQSSDKIHTHKHTYLPPLTTPPSIEVSPSPYKVQLG